LQKLDLRRKWKRVQTKRGKTERVNKEKGGLDKKIVGRSNRLLDLAGGGERTVKDRGRGHGESG